MIMDRKNNMIFEIPENAIKKRSDVCIVCCHDPKEKSGGCYAYGEKVRNSHQYIYYSY